MKIEYQSETYKLKAESIDEISDHISDFLGSLDVEKYNAIGVKLTLEEALLRWRDHFGSKVSVTYSTGTTIGRPFIRLGLEDEPYDPLENSDNEYGYWVDSLMKSMGMDPVYSYSGNENVVMIKFPRPAMDPARKLVISVVLALVIGTVTKLLIPDELLMSFTSTYLQPVQEALFNLLNVAAIPLIFLSVLSVSCGAGNVAARGKDNSRMILHFMLLTTVFTFMGLVISLAVFNMDCSFDVPRGSRFLELFKSIMSVVPSDIMTPFQAGNSPQLIFMALVLGNALLVAGHQADNVIRIVDESYHAILTIADWVSRITPFFVVFILVLGIWGGTLARLSDIWKPVLCFAVASAVMLSVSTFLISRTKNVGMKKLIEKVRPSFMVALKTSSVNTAYGENYNCCVNEMGINSRFADNAIPLGLVLYQPAASLGMLLFSLYTAHVYGVHSSVMWLISITFLTVALEIASPPVAGVDLLSYAAIFSRMGVPSEALILAMVADVLFCFISAAVDQTMLQYELIIEADNTGRLDMNKLRK